jgi:8-oxo-dGTP pyrophosphatase MutT (NUDIX family)
MSRTPPIDWQETMRTNRRPVYDGPATTRWRSGEDYEDIGFSESGRWGNAGSGILFTTGKRILLLHRSSEVTEPGTWGIPGGAIPQTPEGESMDAYESAKKETGEEIGRLPSFKVIDVYDYEEEDFWYTTFIAEVTEKEADHIHPVLNPEHDDYAWVTLDELGDYDLHFGVLELLNHVNPFF